MSSRAKYAKYALEQRQELVNLVIENGISINQASKLVGIKTSTAKLIVKKWKKDRSFTNKKRRTMNEIEQPSSKKPQVVKEQISQNKKEEIIIPTPIHANQAQESIQNYMPNFTTPFYPFLFDSWLMFLPFM